MELDFRAKVRVSCRQKTAEQNNYNPISQNETVKSSVQERGKHYRESASSSDESSMRKSPICKSTDGMLTRIADCGQWPGVTEIIGMSTALLMRICDRLST